MIQEEPKLQSPVPFEAAPEISEKPEGPVDVSNGPPPSGSIKETVTKEIKELIKSYVEYAKSVDL
ncbi:hypothetical protein [Sporomusa sp.]|uniref:hypothetical protein n=1 Tax=Sporomusa sp. TaxID=2078658 RepID=UPI002BFDFF6D|nr:hypothetical protein [Sporomusa sp.]HWR45892.1 hypothetical protein [Sporomusa sp.]